MAAAPALAQTRKPGTDDLGRRLVVVDAHETVRAELHAHEVRGRPRTVLVEVRRVGTRAARRVHRDEARSARVHVREVDDRGDRVRRHRLDAVGRARDREVEGRAGRDGSGRAAGAVARPLAVPRKELHAIDAIASQPARTGNSAATRAPTSAKAKVAKRSSRCSKVMA